MENKRELYNPSYYEGTLQAYKNELEHLQKFGSGRFNQWSMLLEDYKTICDQLRQAKKEWNWKTGTPPKDGWYWSRSLILSEEICYYDKSQENTYRWVKGEWSGPIPEPTDTTETNG